VLAAVTIDALMWAAWCVVVGRFYARRPLDAFRRPGFVTRLRRFERGGDWYERRLRVRAWKHHLPEAGTWFGGMSKSHLPAGARRDSLERFAAESLRAERTHWTVAVATPVFALWNPFWVFLGNVVFAVAINVPCIVVARFNRSRVAALVHPDPR
jgi:glycosyl-4,4'-diaponeurosporenoate acyltransferase